MTAIRTASVIAILCLMSLGAGRGVISSHMNNDMDSTQYLTTLVQFHENVRSGVWFAEWAPDIGRGYGHPLFLFLPPAFTWLAEGFYLCGFAMTSAINAALFVAIVVAACGMYAWSSRWLGAPCAMLSSLAYILAPYFLTNLYVRGAYNEFFSFAFFPWVFLGIDLIVAESKSRIGILICACAQALIFLSHNPMALIGVPATILYAINISRGSKHPTRTVLCSLVALILGAGMSAFFWLPALFLRDLVQTERLLHGYLNYQNHFAYLSQLLYSPWGHDILVPGLHDGMSMKFGEVHITALLLAGLLLLFGTSIQGTRERNLRLWLMSCIAVVCYSLFFASAYSKFVWDRIQLLQYLQFSMRFLAIGTVAAAPLVGASALWLASRIRSERLRALPALAIACLLLALYFPLAEPGKKYPYGEKEHSPMEIARGGFTANNKDEFQPRSMKIVPAHSDSPLQVLEGVAVVTKSSRQPLETTAEVEVHSEEASVRFARTGFPGWELQVNGLPAPFRYDNVWGAVECSLPNGRYEIALSYEGNRFRLHAMFASLGFLVMTIVVALLPRGFPLLSWERATVE